MSKVKLAHPFSVVVMVLLPEHLHVIWRLPAGDADYSIRWSLIKAGFSRPVEKGARIRQSREVKREVCGNDGIGNTKSGMKPIWRARRLHPFQSGETRMAQPSRRLARSRCMDMSNGTCCRGIGVGKMGHAAADYGER